MAEAFDPDKYIAERGLKAPAAPFDPDQYIKEKGLQAPEPTATPEPSFMGMTKSGLIRGSLNALPTVGTVTGGLLGSAGGPGTAMGGAALGGAAGEAFKQLGEKYMYGEGPETSQESAQKIAGEGMLGATAELGGQVIGKVGEAVAPYVAKGAYKLGEAISGVPKKAIEVFKRDPEAIQGMYKSAEGNVATMADEVKATANKAIQGKKMELNSSIEAALKDNPKSVDVTKAIGNLRDEVAKLDPAVSTDKAQIKQINGMINELITGSKQVGEQTLMPIQRAQRFKQSFMDRATPSYNESGHIFSMGNDATRAAKRSAGNLRKVIGEAEPNIQSANSTLSDLHKIDEQINSNILAEGKTPASLLSGGSGVNQTVQNHLKKLSDIVGHDILGDAEKLSASRYFGDPGLLTEGERTGYAATRKGLGGTIGGVLGAGIGQLSHAPGGAVAGGIAGHQIGSVMASPMSVSAAVKAINAGEKVPPEVYQTIRNLSSRGLLEGYLNQAPGNK